HIGHGLRSAGCDGEGVAEGGASGGRDEAGKIQGARCSSRRPSTARLTRGRRDATMATCARTATAIACSLGISTRGAGVELWVGGDAVVLGVRVRYRAAWIRAWPLWGGLAEQRQRRGAEGEGVQRRGEATEATGGRSSRRAVVVDCLGKSVKCWPAPCPFVISLFGTRARRRGTTIGCKRKGRAAIFEKTPPVCHWAIQ
ncbi:hypothetical protein BDV96DRAFT_663841, partial [Lophiotrema nucula]